MEEKLIKFVHEVTDEIEPQYCAQEKTIAEKLRKKLGITELKEHKVGTFSHRIHRAAGTEQFNISPQENRDFPLHVDLSYRHNHCPVYVEIKYFYRQKNNYCNYPTLFDGEDISGFVFSEFPHDNYDFLNSRPIYKNKSEGKNYELMTNFHEGQIWHDIVRLLLFMQINPKATCYLVGFICNKHEGSNSIISGENEKIKNLVNNRLNQIISYMQEKWPGNYQSYFMYKPKGWTGEENLSIQSICSKKEFGFDIRDVCVREDQNFISYIIKIEEASPKKRQCLP